VSLPENREGTRVRARCGGLSAGRDLGDAWGWWLKFERQHGTAVQQEDVIVRCQTVEPSHGAMWQPIAEDDKDKGMSAKEILELMSWLLLLCIEYPVL
jgi:pre-mRNA-processing factor 6